MVAAGRIGDPVTGIYLGLFGSLGLAGTLVTGRKLARAELQMPSGALDPAVQMLGSFLFLATVALAAVDAGRVHCRPTLPTRERVLALLLIAVFSSIQVVAMAVNPFFSASLWLQPNHRLIARGPYRLLRHPGYLAMLVTVPATAIALGSLAGLLPALGYEVLILRRRIREDRLLREELGGYRSTRPSSRHDIHRPHGLLGTRRASSGAVRNRREVRPDASRLGGTETVRFRNDTRRPIGSISLDWYGEILSVWANGVAAPRSPGKQSVALFDLPGELPSGGAVSLSVDYQAPMKLDPKNGSAITSFVSPRLSWGFGTLDDYEVRFHAPDGYAVGTSGRYDPSSGEFRAEGITEFGLFIGKGYQSEEADAGDEQLAAIKWDSTTPSSTARASL